MKGEKTKMSVEDIEYVIQRWETERLTTEQAIGKLLVLLKKQNERILKLEAAVSKMPITTNS